VIIPFHVAMLLPTLTVGGGVLPRAENTVLVLELRAIGIDDTAATAVTALVAEHLARRADLRVVTAAEIDELATHQAQRSKLGCDSDSAACMAEMSAVANARLVLAGTVGAVGDRVIVSLSLIDVDKAASVGSASEILASLDDLPGAMPELLARVFDGPAGQGAGFVLPEQGISLAVLDLKPLGLDAETAANLTQILAVELKRVETARVISQDDVATLLNFEAERGRMDCDEQTLCLAEIGGALGVDKLVVGQAGKLGARYVLSLQLIDVAAIEVNNRVTESFEGLEEQLTYAVRLAGRRVMGIETSEPGTLAVTGGREGALVTLDNQRAGQLPLPPIADLPPGRHSLSLSLEDYDDWRSDFFIESGAVTPLWVVMHEQPPEWYERWWVWAGAAVVVAGGTTAIYLATRDDGASPVTANPPPLP